MIAFNKQTKGVTMRGILLAIAVLFTSAFGAQAQCYLGLGVGAGISSTKASVTGFPVSVDGLGANGVVGSLRAGCDVKVNESFWIGAFGSLDRANQEFKVSPLMSATFTDGWQIGARVGTNFASTRPYILAAYTAQKLSIDIPIPGVDSPSFRGLSLGAGVEFDLSKHWVAGLEGQWTRFQSETVAGLVNLEPQDINVKATLSYRF